MFVCGICNWNCVYVCMLNIKNYIKKINEILFFSNLLMIWKINCLNFLIKYINNFLFIILEDRFMIDNLIYRKNGCINKL